MTKYKNEEERIQIRKKNRRNYYLKYKERLKKESKNYYHKHKEERRKYRKKWYSKQENKEYTKKWNKQYYQKNKERLNKFSQKYYNSHRENILKQKRGYYLSKKEIIQIKINLWKYKEKITEDECKRIIKNGCFICGISYPLEIHGLNGSHKKEDLVALCPTHHALFTRSIIKTLEEMIDYYIN